MNKPRRDVESPRLILIADGFADAGVQEKSLAAARVGPIWIHLRDHEATDQRFYEAAAAFVPALKVLGATVSINSRIAVAEDLNTNLHLGRHGLSLATARRRLPNMIIGYSAHTLQDARMRPAPDYFFFSPVYPTSSKPGHNGAGLEALQQFCRAAGETPVYALGGITPGRTRACLEAGAYGIAVVSGILAADDPTAATVEFLYER